MLEVIACFSDGRSAGSLKITITVTVKPSKLCQHSVGYLCNISYSVPIYDPVLDTFMALDLLLQVSTVTILLQQAPVL